MSDTERKPIYGIGDKVRIVNYGHLFYQRKAGYKEMSEGMEKLALKGFVKAFFDREATEEELSKIQGKDKPNNIVCENQTMWATDMSPEKVGKEDMIEKVSMTQGIPSYSLKENGAWYHEDQLEMVSRNPNND